MKKIFGLVLCLAGCVEQNNIPSDYHPVRVTTHDSVDPKKSAVNHFATEAEASAYRCGFTKDHLVVGQLFFAVGNETVAAASEYCAGLILQGTDNQSILINSQNKMAQWIESAIKTTLSPQEKGACCISEGINYAVNQVEFYAMKVENHRGYGTRRMFENCVLTAQKSFSVIE